MRRQVSSSLMAGLQARRYERQRCLAIAARANPDPYLRPEDPRLTSMFPRHVAMVDTDGRGIHDRATGTAVIMV